MSRSRYRIEGLGGQKRVQHRVPLGSPGMYRKIFHQIGGSFLRLRALGGVQILSNGAPFVDKEQLYEFYCAPLCTSSSRNIIGTSTDIHIKLQLLLNDSFQRSCYL